MHKRKSRDKCSSSKNRIPKPTGCRQDYAAHDHDGERYGVANGGEQQEIGELLTEAGRRAGGSAPKRVQRIARARALWSARPRVDVAGLAAVGDAHFEG